MTVHTNRSSALGHRRVDDMVATVPITDVAALPLAPSIGCRIGNCYTL